MQRRQIRSRRLFAYRMVGISLIEIMVALTITTIIASAIFEMYIVSKHSYQLQMALHDIQFKANIVTHTLKKNIQSAGYMGCRRLAHQVPLPSSTHYQLTPANKLVASNEMLNVKYASQQKSLLHDSMSSVSSLMVNSNITYKVGEILIITDCSKAEIFQIAALSHTKQFTKIIPTVPLHYLFDKEAEVSKLVVNEFYINQSKNEQGQFSRALFVKDIKQHVTKLVDGIDHLTFRFTLRNESGGIALKANEINDWSQVVGVAIEFDVTSYGLTKHWFAYVAMQEGVA